MKIDPCFFTTLPASICRLAITGLLATLAVCLMPVASAQEPSAPKDKPFVAIRATENDSLTISSNGRTALTLGRAPASATGAKLLIVNSAAFPLWSGELKTEGGQWTAQLDRDAIEALLIANAVHAEFPGAASGGKALRISLLREDLGQALDDTAPIVGSRPLFYQAPEAPVPPTPLPANPEVTQIETFAADSLRYDEELITYYYNLITAKASAASLWTDLNTAGRLPAWPASTITTQKRGFAALAAEAEAVETNRLASRASANAIIERWNTAHPDADPISLEFRELS